MPIKRLSDEKPSIIETSVHESRRYMIAKPVEIEFDYFPESECVDAVDAVDAIDAVDTVNTVNDFGNSEKQENNGEENAKNTKVDLSW